MNAATALAKQIELYRQMTGEQRLAIALGLHEMSCDVAREGIRRQHPGADAEEIERLLRERLALARVEIPLVDSAQKAVQVQIVQDAKGK